MCPRTMKLVGNKQTNISILIITVLLENEPGEWVWESGMEAGGIKNQLGIENEP